MSGQLAPANRRRLRLALVGLFLLLPGCELLMLPINLFFALLRFALNFRYLLPLILLAGEAAPPDQSPLAANDPAAGVILSDRPGEDLGRLAETLEARGEAPPDFIATARRALEREDGPAPTRFVLIDLGEIRDEAQLERLIAAQARPGERLRAWIVASRGAMEREDEVRALAAAIRSRRLEVSSDGALAEFVRRCAMNPQLARGAGETPNGEGANHAH